MTRALIVSVLSVLCLLSRIGMNMSSDQYETSEKTPITYFPDLAMQFYNGEKIVSEKCLNQSRLLFRDLQNLTFWASEMWDASAKQPSGFLYGSTYQLGNFDECIYPTWEYKNRPYDVTTQYCLAEIYIHVLPNRTVKVPNPKYDPYGSILEKVWDTDDKSRLRRDLLFWALCVPGSCSYADVESLLNGYLNFTNSMSMASASPGFPILTYEASLSEKSCSKQPINFEYRADTVAFFCLVAILLALSLASTTAHYYLRMQNKQRNADDLDESVPKLLMPFSMIRQLSKLSYNPKSEIKVLNGLRYLSICLIILDHRLGTVVSGPLSNRQNLEVAYKKFYSVFMVHGDLLVDTFFVVSGLVFTYNILKFFEKNNRINITMAIIDRYIRLAPVFAFCMFMMASFMEITGEGPLWNNSIKTEAMLCRSTWWISLLMMGNYIKFDETCLVHGWYIPCDFHFFLITLVALAVLKNRKVPGLITLGVALIISIIIPASVTYYYGLPALLHFDNDFLTMPRSHDVMAYVYVKSHNRAGAFIMGILCACIVYNYNKPEKDNKLSTIKATLGAFLGSLIMFCALISGYIFYDPSRIYNALEAAIYAGFIRVVWSLGLCLLILCTTFGEVPIVKAFLCWNPFAKLSKLVYGMYLIHILFQIREVGISRQPLLLDPLSIFVKALGDMALSTILSFFTYTLIESPIRDLVKLAVNPGNNKRQELTDAGTSASAPVDKFDSSSSTMALHNLSKNMVINNINISRETMQQKM